MHLRSAFSNFNDSVKMSHRLRDFDAIDIVARFMRVPPGRWAWLVGLGLGPSRTCVAWNYNGSKNDTKKKQGTAPTTNLNTSSCVFFFRVRLKRQWKKWVSERSRPKSWQRRRHMKVYDVASAKWAKLSDTLCCYLSLFCLLTLKLNGQRKAKLGKKVKILTLSGRGLARIL